MGKDKLRRFRENLGFRMFRATRIRRGVPPRPPAERELAPRFFHNDHPIVLELGCGKGEYTVALAERDPMRNYIGIDIKGARMWRGARTATDRKMQRSFLRTRIEFINALFAEGGFRNLILSPIRSSRRGGPASGSPACVYPAYYARLLKREPSTSRPTPAPLRLCRR